MRHALQAPDPPLPYLKPDTAQLARRPPVVLLVQADSDNGEMYTEYLRFEGFDAVTTSTVRDALALALAAGVDVVVTGIALPGDLDGVELITRLRANERTRRIPIVALTTFAGNAQRAVAAGCDRCLLKPCLPDELLLQVRGAMRRGLRAPEAE